MARRKLKQTKAARDARRRYRARKKAGKLKRRGCGKGGYSRGPNAYWRCKPGIKRHYYGRPSRRRRGAQARRRPVAVRVVAPVSARVVAPAKVSQRSIQQQLDALLSQLR